MTDLNWRPHTLGTGTDVHHCTTCLQRWNKRPTDSALCPGLPVYRWGEAPEGLLTLKQLDEKRLTPGEARGLLYYSKAPDGYLRLYLESEATPKKPLTEAQIAAHQRMREERSPQGRRRRELAAVREVAASVLASPFVVIDTETLGLWPGDGICEIGVIDHTGAVLLDTRINPLRVIPPDATAIHGITDEMVQRAPTWADVYPALREALRGVRWVGYNVSFDGDFIRAECERCGLDLLRPAAPDGERYNALDVMQLYAVYYGDWSHKYRDYRFKKLSDARYWHDLDSGGRSGHSAVGDAITTLALLKYLADEHSYTAEALP